MCMVIRMSIVDFGCSKMVTFKLLNVTFKKHLLLLRRKGMLHFGIIKCDIFKHFGNV
jgi:hypothetical protein